MPITYLACLILGALGAAGITIVLLRNSIRDIFDGLLDPKTAAAFTTAVCLAVLAISFLAGVGHPSRYNCLETRSSLDWFLVTQHSFTAALTGIFGVLSVVLFSCLVLHVSLLHAKLIGEK